MAINTPDDLENDDEMKEHLEEAIKDAHPLENMENDPFATDALGDKPAENIYGGESQEDSNSGSDFDSDSSASADY